MFPASNWDSAAFSASCKAKYGVEPDYDWAFRTFGGANVKKDFLGYNHIIYPNGWLDPWASGGVREFVNIPSPYYMIEGGAHHLDLRLPMPEDDLTNVGWVRDQIRAVVKRWVIEYQTNHHFYEPTPVFTQ